jgi:hypothetical protein
LRSGGSAPSLASSPNFGLRRRSQCLSEIKVARLKLPFLAGGQNGLLFPLET